MRLTVFLLLLLLPGLAVSVNKSVEGPHLLNIGQELTVRVSVQTDGPLLIEKIEDPIPTVMEASGFPASCAIQGDRLVCSYGNEIEGKVTIPYTLTAKQKSRLVVFDSARVFYKEGDIPSTVSSPPVTSMYYIGPPELNFSSMRILVDNKQQEPPLMALPESPIETTISIKNNGAVAAENVTLSVSVAGWGITKTQRLTDILPEEDRPFKESFIAPKNEGSSQLVVVVKYLDPIDHVAREATTTVPISVARPHVNVERTTRLEWVSQAEGVIPTILIKFTMKNEGKLSATVELKQELPQLNNLQIEPTGQTVGRNTTISLELKPGESNTVSIRGTAEGMNVVVVPSASVSYFDSRGYKYESFSWGSEEIAVKKSIWALLYGVIAPFGIWSRLGAIIIFVFSSIVAWRFYQVDDDRWKWILVPALVGLLLVITFFKIEGLKWLFDVALSPIQLVINIIKGFF